MTNWKRYLTVYLVFSLLFKCGVIGYATEPLVIKDKCFAAESVEECETDLEIVGFDGESFSVKAKTISIGGGELMMWGHGAKHTWIGKIKYEGYIFESDSKEPLQFKVDKKLGYVYLAGKGAITFPDGHKVILP